MVSNLQLSRSELLEKKKKEKEKLLEIFMIGTPLVPVCLSPAARQLKLVSLLSICVSFCKHTITSKHISSIDLL